MLKFIQKFWPFLSLLLLACVIVSLFIWPTITHGLALSALSLSAGIAIFLTVWRNWQAYKQGQLTRVRFATSLTIDIVGLLTVMVAVLFVAGLAGKFFGEMAWKASAAKWPGSEQIVGVLAGSISGVAAGFGTGWVMRWVWGKVSKRMQKPLGEQV